MVIGLLVSGLFEEYNQSICRTIEKAAKENGDKVVIITGKYLDFDLTSALSNFYEYQYNSSFSYGEVCQLDGLIIEMASVGMFATEESKRRFAERFKDIPHVFISYEAEGISNVSIDNRSGMREGLDYLYDAGIRDYIMIGGPVDNKDAAERKEVFFDFHREKGLEIKDGIYSDGDFILDCKDKIEELIDSNPNAKALVCANDILARNACRILHKKGLVVGRDISVLGYDDNKVATIEHPHIATVLNDFTLLGQAAYTLIKETLSGDSPRNEKVLTRFIKRESVIDINCDDEKTIEREEKYQIATFDSLLRNKAFVDEDGDEESLRILYSRIIDIIIDDESYKVPGYASDILGKLISEGYKLELPKYIDTNVLVEELKRLVSIKLEENKDDIKKSGIIMDTVLDLGNSIIGMVNYQLDLEAADRQDNIWNMQTYFSESISFEHGDDTSYEKLISNLDWFGINYAYLFIYKESMYNLQNELFIAPKHIYLKAYLKDKKVTVVPGEKQRVRTHDMLSSKVIDWKEIDKLVMFPLYHGEQLFGVLLCDMKSNQFKKSSILVSQVSLATKMISILWRQEKTLEEYEDILQVLKSNNIELEKLSKLDALTGMVNRRGFLAGAEKLLKKSAKNNKKFMVIYADMNNLKIINDKYGHDDGDYALRETGRILNKHFNTNAIAGRIGGDEFAIAMISSDEKKFFDKIRAVQKEFDSFNEKSSVGYIVSICMGNHIVNPGDGTDLQNALMIADSELYKAKQSRTKNIYKVQ